MCQYQIETKILALGVMAETYLVKLGPASKQETNGKRVEKSGGEVVV